MEIKEHGKFDLAALLWYERITEISTLVEYQESDVSEKQIAHLRKVFWGGMGSFHDLAFDENQLGYYAAGLNNRLDEFRRQLYLAFEE